MGDCTDDAIDVPLVRVQAGLRDLGVHTQLLLLLETLILELSGDIPESDSIVSLVSEAFHLLSRFAMSNTR